MILRAIVFSIVFYKAISLCGQSITGRISDAATNEPVPYAHVRISNTHTGTIANAEGKFSLSFASTEVLIEISCIGYQNKKLTAKPGDYLVISLEPVKKYLDDVVIVPKDKAKTLLLAAINNIPINYPDTTEMLTTFYRHQMSDPVNNSPFYLVEMIIKVLKPTYEKQAHKVGIVKLEQSRKLEFKSLDSTNARFYGGIHMAFWGDPVARRKGPLNIDHLDHYWLEITDTLYENNRSIYVIDFEPKEKKAQGSGRVYIQDSTFSICQIAVSYNQKECDDLLDDIRGMDRIYGRIECYYLPYVDGWRLSRINYQTEINRHGVPYIKAEDELIVTEIEGTFEEIPYRNQIDYREITLSKVGAYDSMFWDGKNTMLPNDEYLNSLKNYEIRDSSNVTKREKIISFLSKFSYTFEIGLIPVSNEAVRVKNLYLNEGISAQSQFIGTYSTEMNFRINHNWQLGFLGRASFKKIQYNGSWATLGYQYNIMPGRRPIYLIPSISVGFQNSFEYLTTIRQSDPIKVGKKYLESDKIDVYVTQKSISVMPGLKLGFEKNRRTYYYTYLNYSPAIRPKLGLYYREHQVFGQKAFEYETESESDFNTSSKQLFDYKWHFGAGVSFSF